MKTLGARLALLYSLVSTLTLFVLLATGYYLLSRHLVHGLDLLNAAEFERVKPRLWAIAALPAEEAEALPSGASSQETLSFMMESSVPIEASSIARRISADAICRRMTQRKPINAAIPGIGELRVGRFLAGGFEVRWRRR